MQAKCIILIGGEGEGLLTKSAVKIEYECVLKVEYKMSEGR